MPGKLAVLTAPVRLPVPLPPRPLAKAVWAFTVAVVAVAAAELLWHSVAGGPRTIVDASDEAWRAAPRGTGVSIIVPTYHEADNVRPLAQRVFEATEAAGLNAELLLVDDSSNDGTVEIAWALRNEHPTRDLSVIVRTPEEGTGLSSAVMLGLVRAKHQLCVVMDADLSHPPEVIPQMVGWLAEPPAAGGGGGGGGDGVGAGADREEGGGDSTRAHRIDFVLGSRYAAGGAVSKEWPWYRRVISGGATMVARPLVGVTDPMSGFFALRKDQLSECNGVNAVGFKIALELMANCGIENVAEAPITFHDRVMGASKLKAKTAIQYVWQLGALYWAHFTFTAVCVALFKLALLAYGVWRVRNRVRGDDWRPQLGALLVWLPDPVALVAACRGQREVLKDRARPRRLPVGVEELRVGGCFAWQQPTAGYVSVFGGGLPMGAVQVKHAAHGAPAYTNGGGGGGSSGSGGDLEANTTRDD
uniref:Dolichol-phosphate mannosyltransferase subunit 1 n=1 Tax=Bicosoecida sp. CB-2014 TaxID=1486930 RepID=A0A7S1C7X4_9STRA|mmetsp:Transcript_16980/g.59456  ORF Transcript_16980/g.59456 Transcript_16980/m.59456 type:complete len:474 (+) Transcript_16980:20-1441(+)